MKKLLLLSALVFSVMGASAQNFSVTVEGNPVENGATVNAYNYELFSDTDPVSGMTLSTFQLLPEVCVNPAKSGSYDIKVTNTSTPSSFQQEYLAWSEKEQGIATDPYVVLFCWPINCDNISIGKSSTQSGSLTAGTYKDLKIDSQFLNLVPPVGFTASCKIEVFEQGSTTSVFNLNLNMVYNPDIEAVEGIEAEDAAPVYYNLNGMQVANPDHGIYIVKKGGKTSKIIL